MKIYRIIFFVVCAAIVCSSDCSVEDLDFYGHGLPHPEKPYDLYPYYESINNSRTPVFAWRCEEEDPAFELTFTYEVYLKRADDTGPQYEYESNEKSLQCPITLDPETEYIFWVKAIAGNELTETSETGRFTTGTGFNNPPHKPVIIVPKHGESYDLGLTFSWICNDPDGDNLTYDVLLKEVDSGEYETLSEGQTTTVYQPTSLEYSTDYYLKIVAHDAENENTSYHSYFDITNECVGVYAELMIHRSQYISKGIPPDPDERIVLDHVYARFDSLYAPDGPLFPKKPPAVTYFVGGDVTLWWDDAASRYYRNNPISGSFLAAGRDYTFTVTEGDGVPALTKMIHYPECRPYLITPDAFSFVPKDGFEVTWSGHDLYDDCPAEIRIRIMDMGPLTWTDIDRMVPNTGSYTFTEGELSVLDPMAYQIQVVLIIENREYIDEPGYDPRSWAWARTHSTLFLYLN